MAGRMLRLAILVSLAVIGAADCQSEIDSKLRCLAGRYDHHVGAAFNTYDRDCNGCVDSSEVHQVLFDAGVSWICRWPGQVVAHFDTNRDNCIQRDEL